MQRSRGIEAADAVHIYNEANNKSKGERSGNFTKSNVCEMYF